MENNCYFAQKMVMYKSRFLPKNKLKAVRKERSLKQSELSELIFMEQSQYSRRERGKLPITDDEWDRIAKALTVNKEEIYESDSKIINIANNHDNKDNSINGFEIIIKAPNNVLEDLSIKLDKVIELLETTRKGD